jgi:hypothetical protein
MPTLAASRIIDGVPNVRFEYTNPPNNIEPLKQPLDNHTRIMS